MKPKILIFLDWFLPGYKAGGPIKSVANIVASLKHEIDFSIVTSNADFGDCEPYQDIESNIWLQQEGFRVIYLDRHHQNIKYYKRLLNEQVYSSIYFNSLFSIPFTVLPLLAHKFSKSNAKKILAPRGMLGKGALNIKRKKKQVFLLVSQFLGLFKDIIWHASTLIEESEIKAVFGSGATVIVATNIASSPDVAISCRTKTPDNTSFFFLSRISPKKNLLGALKFLLELNLHHSLNFYIIGPVEDEPYWKKCKDVITQFPNNSKVHYLGAVPNPKLPALLKQFHFLLLPTQNENYGHVVVEAWENGCPVILSDQTPWRGLEFANVGWDIPLNRKERFLQVLEQCILMENEQFQKMSKQTQQYLKENVVTVDIINQNKRLFGVQV